jgi:hypothetical protein
VLGFWAFCGVAGGIVGHVAGDAYGSEKAADLLETRMPDLDIGPVPDWIPRKCRNLWKRLQEHLAKLSWYQSDPFGMDNQRLLHDARNKERIKRIIDGRTTKLERDIRNFRRLLAKCLASEGAK